MSEATRAAREVRSRRLFGVCATLVMGPGFGHVIVGKWRRAALWWLTIIVLLALAPLALWPMLGWALATRIAASVDVVRIDVESAEIPPWWLAVLWLGGLSILSFSINRFVRPHYAEAFRIPSATMVPTLKIGDHVFVEKWDREVRRGDLAVFKNPCTLDKTYVKRVVAVGGDSVEVRCSQLYVNGELVERKPAGGRCEYWDYYDDTAGWELSTCTLYTETLDGRTYQIVEDETYPQRLAEVSESADSEFKFGRDFPGFEPPSCEDPSVQQAAGEVRTGEPPTGPCAAHRSFVVPEGHFFALGDNRENSFDSRMWGAVPNENVIGKVSYVWWSAGRDGETRWSRIGVAPR